MGIVNEFKYFLSRKIVLMESAVDPADEVDDKRAHLSWREVGEDGTMPEVRQPMLRFRNHRLHV